MSYSESRANYAKVLDDAVNNREEIIITRSGRESVVMLSLSEYESMKETAYLMRSPRNAQRILEAINRLDMGESREHGLIDIPEDAGENPLG